MGFLSRVIILRLQGAVEVNWRIIREALSDVCRVDSEPRTASPLWG